MALINYLSDAVISYNLPITPLSVTAFLFLWIYERDELDTRPITSFALLLDRFSKLWAKREAKSTTISFFKDSRQLLEVFELAAWILFLNQTTGAVSLSYLAKEIFKKTGVASDLMMADRGFLSILRLKKDIYEDKKNDIIVISFVHEALFEFMLAKKLVNALLISARPEIGKNEISRHQKINILVAATQG
jgi:hypothetical protein